MFSDLLNNTDNSAATTVWFTNTSYTCKVEQTTYRCQVVARSFNTYLGILDHAPNLCTNKILYGDSCRECSQIQIITCSYYSNEGDCVNYSDERCVQMYLDQYMDLTDLGFRPHNYSSQDMNSSLKCFSILSQSQSWGFTSRSTARVILGQVLRIATCGTRTHRGDSL